MVEMEQPVDILICQNLHLMELDIVLLPMDNPGQDNTYKEGIIHLTEAVDHPLVEQGQEVKVGLLVRMEGAMDLALVDQMEEEMEIMVITDDLLDLVEMVAATITITTMKTKRSQMNPTNLATTPTTTV